jgi:hypothetical protein
LVSAISTVAEVWLVRMNALLVVPRQEREQHGRQHRRLPAPVLAAQEVQPLVRHKREFLRMKNNERVRIW